MFGEANMTYGQGKEFLKMFNKIKYKRSRERSVFSSMYMSMSLIGHILYFHP